jgi:hypothetical protein
MGSSRQLTPGFSDFNDLANDSVSPAEKRAGTTPGPHCAIGGKWRVTSANRRLPGGER